MVSSNESPGGADSNRIIIAVTGANGGLGLGYCHRLLRQLSLPQTSPYPDTFLLHPSHPSSRPSPPDFSLPAPTLTLILACRNKSKAEKAIAELKREHEMGLVGRRMKGIKEVPGWSAGLRLVFEPLDVDSPSSILSFTSRLSTNYPHLTTLVLNAGILPLTGVDWNKAIKQMMVDPVGSVTEPNFMITEKGRMSGDGQRGGVWGVNTLAGYVLAKELLPLLSRSPTTLPLCPRIIYVSSKLASPRFLPRPPPSSSTSTSTTSHDIIFNLSNHSDSTTTLISKKDDDINPTSPAPIGHDPQLILQQDSYDASKYMSELLVARLDSLSLFGGDGEGNEMDSAGSGAGKSAEKAMIKDKGKEKEMEKQKQKENENEKRRRVRVLMVDPGVVHTGLTDFLPWFMEILMVIVFHIARLFGSPANNIAPENGAAAMVYLTLVDSPALDIFFVEDEDESETTPLVKTNLSTTSLPPIRYCSRTSRFGSSYVVREKVKEFEVYSGGYTDGIVKECERVWKGWKDGHKREVIVDK